MATGGEFDIKFTADSSDLRAELEKVAQSLENVADSTSGATNDMRKGLDSAKSSAQGLAKKVPSVGTAAKPVNEQLKQTGNSAQIASDRLSNMEGAAGMASSSMSGLAGALSIVSPEAGAMADVVSRVTGGLEATARGGIRVFAILGPIAAAVTAAGAAYAYFKGQLDDANAALETQRGKLESVQDMHRKVKEAVLLGALALGTMEQAEYDALSAAQSASDLTRVRRDALTEERNALNQKRIALELSTVGEERALKVSEQAISVLRGADKRHAAFGASVRKTMAATDDHSGALADVNRKLALNKTQTETLTATEKRYAKAITDSKTKIESKSTASSKAAEVEEELDTGRLDALEQLGRIVEEQNAKKLEGADLLRDNAEAEIALIQEVNAEYVNDWEVKTAVMSAHHAVRDRLTRDIRALDAKAEKEREAESKRYYAAERTRKQALVRVTMSANTDLMGSTADLFMAMSTATAEHDKKTARTLFNVWKGLSLAHIALKQAEGYMTAAALPPPADIIKAAAVTAAAGASAIIVGTTKPPFHAGSSFVRAPDRTSEMNARLRAGEAVSTPLGAEILGRDNIAAANAGMGTGGGNAPIVFQYEHRAFTRFIRDNVRGVSGGLSDEINSGRTIGQRGVSR